MPPKPLHHGKLAPPHRATPPGRSAKGTGAVDDHRVPAASTTSSAEAIDTASSATTHGLPRPTKRQLKKLFPAPPTKDLIIDADSPPQKGHYGQVVRATWTSLGSDRVIAIKQTPVQAAWTLDEVHNLHRCADGGDRIVACLACWYHDESDALWIAMDWVGTATLGTIVDATRRQLDALRSRKVYRYAATAATLRDLDDAAPAIATDPLSSLRLWSPACEGDVAFLVRELLLALAKVHDAGMVHLDVKPENVFIDCAIPATCVPTDPEAQLAASGSSRGFAREGCRVVLGDFGTAQAIGSPLQQLGDFLFMAPEVFAAVALGTEEAREADDDDDDAQAEKVDRDDDDGDALPNDEEVAGLRGVGIFRPANDTWSVGCVLIALVEGYRSAFDLTGMDVDPSLPFQVLSRCYVAPTLKNASRWSPPLLHFLALCFERDASLRPSAKELLGHPFVQRGQVVSRVRKGPSARVRSGDTESRNAAPDAADGTTPPSATPKVARRSAEVAVPPPAEVAWAAAGPPSLKKADNDSTKMTIAPSPPAADGK